MKGQAEADEEGGDGSKKYEGLAEYCEEGVQVEAEVGEVPETEEEGEPGEKKGPGRKVLMHLVHLGSGVR